MPLSEGGVISGK